MSGVLGLANKYQIYLWPVFAVVVIVLLILLVMFPQVRELLKENAILEETVKKVAVLEKKAKDLQSVDEVKYQSDLDTSLSMVPVEKDLVSALSQIQILTANNNMKVDDVGFSSSSQTATDKSDNFIVRVTITSTIDQLKTFLDQVKVAPRLMMLDSIALENSKTTGVYQATLGFKTYFQPLPTTLGRIEDPLLTLSTTEQALLQRVANSLRNVPVVSSDRVFGKRGKDDPFR